MKKALLALCSYGLPIMLSFTFSVSGKMFEVVTSNIQTMKSKENELEFKYEFERAKLPLQFASLFVHAVFHKMAELRNVVFYPADVSNAHLKT